MLGHCLDECTINFHRFLLQVYWKYQPHPTYNCRKKVKKNWKLDFVFTRRQNQDPVDKDNRTTRAPSSIFRDIWVGQLNAIASAESRLRDLGSDLRGCRDEHPPGKERTFSILIRKNYFDRFLLILLLKLLPRWKKYLLISTRYRTQSYGDYNSGQWAHIVIPK